MVKHIAVIMTLFVACSAAFAQNIDVKQDTPVTKKLENKLSTAHKKNQENAPENLTIKKGILEKGSFSKNATLEQKKITDASLKLDIEFTITDKGIEYEAKYDSKKEINLEFSSKYEEDRPGSADPHAPVSLEASVKASYKTSKNAPAKEKSYKAKLLSMEKYELYSSEYGQVNTQGALAYVDNQGNCTECGEKNVDRYHHSCKPKAAAKETASNPGTKVITRMEKQHAKDCLDKYHCDCPEKPVKVTVAKEAHHVKIHTKDCLDKYHCDCPTEVEYR